jgi:predicted DNA-binding WGR domain protein
MFLVMFGENNVKPYSLYRFDNPDGSSKSWGIRSNQDGSYTTIWGKTNAKMTSKTKSFSHNKDDVSNLISSKTRKGYYYCGDIYIGSDGKLSPVNPASEFKHEPIEPSFPSEDPQIYWTIKYTGDSSSKTNEFKRLIQRTKEIFVRFGRDFDESPIAKSTVLKNSGIIKKEDGVFVFLFLLALKKFSPLGITVSLSHEDGVEISHQLKMETMALSYFEADEESIRPIAEELGLLVARIDLSAIVSDIQDIYF